MPPSGTWERRSADLFALAEDWLGPENARKARGSSTWSAATSRGFGPAVRTNRELGRRLAPDDRDGARRLELRRASRTSRAGARRPPARCRSPRDAGAGPLPPDWDATLLVHARRTQILPEEYRSRVFNTKTPHSVPTFLVDGQVAGTWKHEKGHVKVSPFSRLPKGVRSELDDEAERLAQFHS